MFLLMYAWSSNEAEVGSAVRKSGIPRDEVYITTKVSGLALPVWSSACTACCRGQQGTLSNKLLFSLAGVEHGPWLSGYHEGLQRKSTKVRCTSSNCIQHVCSCWTDVLHQGAHLSKVKWPSSSPW